MAHDDRYKEAVIFFIFMLIMMIIAIVILCVADKKSETGTRYIPVFLYNKI